MVNHYARSLQLLLPPQTSGGGETSPLLPLLPISPRHRSIAVPALDPLLPTPTGSAPASRRPSASLAPPVIALFNGSRSSGSDAADIGAPFGDRLPSRRASRVASFTRDTRLEEVADVFITGGSSQRDQLSWQAFASREQVERRRPLTGNTEDSSAALSRPHTGSTEANYGDACSASAADPAASAVLPAAFLCSSSSSGGAAPSEPCAALDFAASSSAADGSSFETVNPGKQLAAGLPSAAGGGAGGAQRFTPPPAVLTECCNFREYTPEAASAASFALAEAGDPSDASAIGSPQGSTAALRLGSWSGSSCLPSPMIRADDGNSLQTYMETAFLVPDALEEAAGVVGVAGGSGASGSSRESVAVQRSELSEAERRRAGIGAMASSAALLGGTVAVRAAQIGDRSVTRNGGAPATDVIDDEVATGPHSSSPRRASGGAGIYTLRDGPYTTRRLSNVRGPQPSGGSGRGIGENADGSEARGSDASGRGGCAMSRLVPLYDEHLPLSLADLGKFFV